MTRPGAKPRVELAPESERGPRHRLARGDSTGDQVTKGHEGPHLLNFEAAEFRLEPAPAALKNDP